MKLIITHDGKFHSDEVCALAVLKLIYPDAKITRTRDESKFKKADILVDVGREYNPRKRRFDHHQKDFNLKRKNGIPYASFGLIWKHFGGKLIRESEGRATFDEKIVQFIDAIDSGVNIPSEKIHIFSIYDIITSLNPIWDKKENEEKNFKEVLNLTTKIISRQIEQIKSFYRGKKLIERKAKKSKNPYLILPNKNLDWRAPLLKYPRIKYVLFPLKNGDWLAYATYKHKSGFERIKNFPKNWWGKENEELESASDVKGAQFCHKGGFLCRANSKKAILELVNRALGKKTYSKLIK